MQIPCVYLPGPAPAVSVANIYNVKGQYHEYAELDFLFQSLLCKLIEQSDKLDFKNFQVWSDESKKKFLAWKSSFSSNVAVSVIKI